MERQPRKQITDQEWTGATYLGRIFLHILPHGKKIQKPIAKIELKQMRTFKTVLQRTARFTEKQSEIGFANSSVFNQ